MHEVYTIFYNKAIFVKTVNRFNAELFHKNCICKESGQHSGESCW